MSQGSGSCVALFNKACTLIHSLSFLWLSLASISLVEADVILSISLSPLNPVLSQIPSLHFTPFPEWRQIGFTKANPVDGLSFRLYIHM